MVLLEAVKDRNLEVVKFILEKKLEPIDTKDNDGNTALIIASDKNDYYKKDSVKEGLENLEIVKELLKNGANVNEKDNFGYTALMLASKYGHIELIKEMLKNGGDVNAKSAVGNTALILASQYGRIELLKELLKNGGDVNAKSNMGITAFNVASTIEIKKLLKDELESKESKQEPEFESSEDFEIIQKEIIQKEPTYENISKTIHKAFSEYDVKLADSCLDFMNSISSLDFMNTFYKFK